MASNKMGRPTKEQALEKEKLKVQETAFMLQKKQLAMENKELRDEIQKMGLELSELRNKVKEYKANEILDNESPEAIKKILMHYAKGSTYKTIHDKMQFYNFTGDIEFIQYVCQNVEAMDNEFLLYYKEQIEAYEKSIKINPDLINNTLIQVLQQNINDASADLEGLTDTKEKSDLRTEITKHAKQLTDLTKNVADIKEDVKQNESLTRIFANITNTLEDYEEDYEELDLNEVVVM